MKCAPYLVVNRKRRPVHNARRTCPLCGAIAIRLLTLRELAAQPDATTHACDPAFGGCGHGFEVVS